MAFRNAIIHSFINTLIQNGREKQPELDGERMVQRALFCELLGAEQIFGEGISNFTASLAILNEDNLISECGNILKYLHPSKCADIYCFCFSV